MIRLITLSTALLFAAGCAKQGPPDNEGNEPTANQTENDHGERKPLGDLSAHGHKFAVVQFGDVAAGQEAAFELEFGSAEERITTVRGWIGTEDGKGSMKSPWSIDDVAKMHGHVEVPEPIPAGSKLWLDLERDGDTVTLSIPYK